MPGTEEISEAEVERNYRAFKEIVRELVQTHPGKFALMHQGKLADVFDTFSDALKYGNAIFGAGKFTVQAITLQPVDLGWYGHAVHHAAV
jgi:hypothetical protein